MAASLQASVQVLEQKVEERTHDLAEVSPAVVDKADPDGLPSVARALEQGRGGQEKRDRVH